MFHVHQFSIHFFHSLYQHFVIKVVSSYLPCFFRTKQKFWLTQLSSRPQYCFLQRLWIVTVQRWMKRGNAMQTSETSEDTGEQQHLVSVYMEQGNPMFLLYLLDRTNTSHTGEKFHALEYHPVFC